MDCYREAIAEIDKQLQDETLGEIQTKMGNNHYDYEGVGFGYQKRDASPDTQGEMFETPELNEIWAMVEAL